MKNLLLIFCGCALLTIISCGEDNIPIVVDPAVQRAADIVLINEFIAEKGYASVDTTNSGVRYLTTSEGTGTEIDESDFVSFHYTARLFSDTIFDTSISEVADSIHSVIALDTVGRDDIFNETILLDIFSPENDYLPYEITYSSSGWSFAGLVNPRLFTNELRCIGFEDGIAASFKNLKVGGSARIIVPSSLAYGVQRFDFLIPANSILIFDVYPIKVKKQ